VAVAAAAPAVAPALEPATALRSSHSIPIRRALLVEAGTRWDEWRYRSNAELAVAFRELHAGDCAGISTLGSIGTSADGEDIPVFEISLEPGKEQAKPGFAFIGNMHGDEPVGREFILRLARLLCVAHQRSGAKSNGEAWMDEGDGPHAATAAALVRGARLFLLPTVNPDGVAGHLTSCCYRRVFVFVTLRDKTL
jgi:carboxypeptidase D